MLLILAGNGAGWDVVPQGSAVKGSVLAAQGSSVVISESNAFVGNRMHSRSGSGGVAFVEHSNVSSSNDHFEGNSLTAASEACAADPGGSRWRVLGALAALARSMLRVYCFCGCPDTLVCGCLLVDVSGAGLWRGVLY